MTLNVSVLLFFLIFEHLPVIQHLTNCTVKRQSLVFFVFLLFPTFFGRLCYILRLITFDCDYRYYAFFMLATHVWLFRISCILLLFDYRIIYNEKCLFSNLLIISKLLYFKFKVNNKVYLFLLSFNLNFMATIAKNSIFNHNLSQQI